MNKPVILRKRFIPNETTDISSDELLFRSHNLLVTRWKAINPRDDFYGGISFTFLDKGYKLSRFYDEKRSFLYWYCDIIEVIYDKSKDTFLLNDLLVDIKIFSDGSVRVLDIDELVQAMEEGLISSRQVLGSLKILDGLLKRIYNGEFPPAECAGYEY